jgi:hypothetical protein
MLPFGRIANSAAEDRQMMRYVHMITQQKPLLLMQWLASNETFNQIINIAEVCTAQTAQEVF